MRSVIALAWVVVVLAMVGNSIAAKEALLKNGTVTYLELAPVDPRSLMQGDYMALRFGIANDVRRDLEPDEPAGRSGTRREKFATADGNIVAVMDSSSAARRSAASPTLTSIKSRCCATSRLNASEATAAWKVS